MKAVGLRDGIYVEFGGSRRDVESKKCELGCREAVGDVGGEAGEVE